jgi:hypothetical protein
VPNEEEKPCLNERRRLLGGCGEGKRRRGVVWLLRMKVGEEKEEEEGSSRDGRGKETAVL